MIIDQLSNFSMKQSFSGSGFKGSGFNVMNCRILWFKPNPEPEKKKPLQACKHARRAFYFYYSMGTWEAITSYRPYRPYHPFRPYQEERRRQAWRQLFLPVYRPPWPGWSASKMPHWLHFAGPDEPLWWDR